MAENEEPQTSVSVTTPAKKRGPPFKYKSNQLIQEINNGKWPLLLIIMRGLPGSGKSTMAKKICEKTNSGVILSTDNYFVANGGFDPKKLPEAHQWNQSEAQKQLKDRLNTLVIIDNTNVLKCEALPYVKLAIQYNYAIKILEPETPWAFNVDELVKRSIHEVPRPVIIARLRKYEKFSEIEICQDAIKELSGNEDRSKRESNSSRSSSSNVGASHGIRDDNWRTSNDDRRNEPNSVTEEPNNSSFDLTSLSKSLSTVMNTKSSASGNLKRT